MYAPTLTLCAMRPPLTSQAEYEPSELRCELARQWVPISIARPRLDIAKFCALDHDLTPAESESAAAVNVAESAACAGSYFFFSLHCVFFIYVYRICAA